MQQALGTDVDRIQTPRREEPEGLTKDSHLLDNGYSTGETILLQLFSRVEELRSQMAGMQEELRILQEEREAFGFAANVHSGSPQSFRIMPEGEEVEIDGEAFRSHHLVKLESGTILVARTKRNGRCGYLLLVRRGRLMRSESLGPLEERILALLIAGRDQGKKSGLNAREIEIHLEQEQNVIPNLINAPVDSSIRSSVCRLRGKLARLGGPRAQILKNEGGYRLRP